MALVAFAEDDVPWPDEWPDDDVASSPSSVLPTGITELEVQTPSQVCLSIPSPLTLPLNMPIVDVATSDGTFDGLSVPPNCSVGLFKQLLERGELLSGGKIPYSSKLTCYAMTCDGEAGPALELSALLPLRPATLAVCGPAVLLQALQIALTVKLGKPDKLRVASPVAKAAGLSPLPLRSGGGDSGLQFFFLGLKGHREYMEDRACAVLELPRARTDDNGPRAALFGVFDGHGGDQVSDLVARHLPNIVASQLAQVSNSTVALERSFALADAGLRDGSENKPSKFDLIGTTAIVALLLHADGGKGRQLLCANCGDSRAVLCRDGRAVDLSVDHRPTHPSEEQRILTAGGRVDRGRLQMGQGGEGGLSLSRSLGDFAYKAPGHGQALIARPDVQKFDVGPEDEFMALGSDGIFDAMSSSELVAHLREAFQRGDTLEQAVQKVVDETVPGGDNVTLCVVRFRGKEQKGIS